MELRSRINKDKSVIQFHLVDSIKLEKPDEVKERIRSTDSLQPSIVNTSSKTVKETRFQCVLCDRFLASMCSLRRHMQIHTPNRLKCKFCSETFLSKHKFLIHVSEHTGIKPYKCKSCDQRFGTAIAREIHIKKLHIRKDKLNKCSKCPATFIMKCRLLAHELVHTTDAERKTDQRLFQCPKCDKKFTQGGHIQDHLLLHENPNHYTCHVCGKRSTRSSDLKRHMLIHGTERKFSCLFCSMRFTRFDALNQHIRRHTGEKPYKCKHCSEVFQNSYNLQVHECSSGKISKKLTEAENSHKSPNINTPPQFQCSICTKIFKRDQNLKIHISRIHADERPFNCKFCERKFAYKYALETHILRAHTKEKPYVCNFCDKRFDRQSCLGKHLKFGRCPKNKNGRTSAFTTIRIKK